MVELAKPTTVVLLVFIEVGGWGLPSFLSIIWSGTGRLLSRWFCWVRWLVAEKKTSYSTIIIRCIEKRCIDMDIQYHIAAMLSDSGIGMGGDVVKKFSDSWWVEELGIDCEDNSVLSEDNIMLSIAYA